MIIQLQNIKTKYLNILNNTVVASPRGLIAFLENHYTEDGRITIPEVLRPYMGGKEEIILKQSKSLFFFIKICYN